MVCAESYDDGSPIFAQGWLKRTYQAQARYGHEMYSPGKGTGTGTGMADMNSPGTGTPSGTYTALFLANCARSIKLKMMVSSWRMSELQEGRTKFKEKEVSCKFTIVAQDSGIALQYPKRGGGDGLVLSCVI